MSDYNMTDREQAEVLKKWWKDYGRAIAIAIAIGLAIGFGWRFWHQHQLKQAEQASLLYQNLSTLAFQKKTQQAEQFSSRLMKDYPSSPYSAFAALWSAEEAVSEGNLSLALSRCQWVVTHTPLLSLRQVARIRAARILLAQKKPLEAMTVLGVVDDKTFLPLIESVKGDIYSAEGNQKAAKKAYNAAKVGLSSSINAVDPLLNLKLSQ